MSCIIGFLRYVAPTRRLMCRYYLVTEGLAARHSLRVRDFPPDETALIGVGVGYSQMGLLPIVEIPYAKVLAIMIVITVWSSISPGAPLIVQYLDCGADMFFEAIISNWLSNGRQPNGMIIRLQGFDKGVFGGNFHTHNMLHIPPGLDVVCFSNGADYARGMRYAFQQAKAGRIVMSVDSTHLLNLRHLHDGDDAWRRPYPTPGETMTFDQVVRYGDGARLAIVSYGNGVLTALRACRTLEQRGVTGISVIDSPYLSAPSAGLVAALKGFDRVVFADVCKEGQHPFGGIITRLQAQGALPARWQCVAAQPTYNPLGTTLTFTSEEDIMSACLKVL
jgi:2-oxoisovalerate dehydrogenase E1 component